MKWLFSILRQFRCMLFFFLFTEHSQLAILALIQPKDSTYIFAPLSTIYSHKLIPRKDWIGIHVTMNVLWNKTWPLTSKSNSKHPLLQQGEKEAVLLDTNYILDTDLQRKDRRESLEVYSIRSFRKYIWN